MDIEIKFSASCDERLKRIIRIVLTAMVQLYINKWINDKIVLIVNPITDTVVVEGEDYYNLSSIIEEYKEKINAYRK